MKIYISAPSELQEEAARWSRLFEMNGFQMTSSWTQIKDLFDIDKKRLTAAAWTDLREVAEADILVALNPENFARSGTGGRHVELGIALALHKWIVLYGDRTNVFHHHPSVRLVESPGDLIKAVKRMFNFE